MSISNTTTKQIYAGNGVATSFPIPFSFIPGLLTTIKVSIIDDLTGVITPAGLGDYTLSPAGDNPTAVVYGVAPITGNSVLVERVMPITQVVDYTTNGAFLAESHETGLDRIVLMIQELADKVSRAVSVHVLDEGNIDIVFPPLIAGRVLGVNALGTEFEWVDRAEFKGDKGDTGDAATIAVGTVNTVLPTDPATVNNVGTTSAAIFDFGIPQGEAATIAVGTVTTVLPADPATVTNVGTTGAAVFDFEIPKGDKVS